MSTTAHVAKTDRCELLVSEVSIVEAVATVGITAARDDCKVGKRGKSGPIRAEPTMQSDVLNFLSQLRLRVLCAWRPKASVGLGLMLVATQGQLAASAGEVATVPSSGRGHPLLS